jgi:hypothetical protein
MIGKSPLIPNIGEQYRFNLINGLLRDWMVVINELWERWKSVEPQS